MINFNTKDATLIKKRIKEGLVDCKYLFELAQSDPMDKSIATLLFEQYERVGERDIKDQLTYLQLKYLHEPLKSEYLNKMAEIYLKQNKRIVAFMCLIESLRINPNQSRVFEISESLKECIRQKFPEKLKENCCMVTVIMATYGRTGEIREAIQSVLNQTFQDFELIIINDGGLDEIKSVVENFHSTKIKYYKLEENKGLRAALNEGILRAGGKYIAYLDDDDIYYPNHLEELVKTLERTNYKFVYTNTQGIKGVVKHGEFKPLFRSFLWDKEFNRDELVLKNNIGNLSIMHHKSLFSEVGLFIEDKVTSMDLEMWLRIAQKFSCLHVNKNTGEYRIKADNRTVKNRVAIYCIDKLIRNYFAFYQGKIAYMKFYLNKGEMKKARLLYDDIIDNYRNYFKTEALVRELINIARNLNYNKFSMRLVKDYFRFNARSSLRECANARSLPMLLGIMPLLPEKILRSARARSAYYGKQMVKKGKAIANEIFHIDDDSRKDVRI